MWIALALTMATLPAPRVLVLPLDRTESVVREVSSRALATDGIEHAIAFPGLNGVHFTNTPSTAEA